jgi:HAD superfamily hydrolase (TIGR01509 family)
MEQHLDALPGLPKGRYAAYLFDLDGTVSDSMPLHFRSWLQAVEEFGGSFPRELFMAWGGIPLPRTVQMLNEHMGTSLPVLPVVERKEQLFLERLTELQPVASVVAEMDRVRGRIPMAIVSGSPRNSIVRTLAHLGLADRFETIVGAEDYTSGKPDPEPFLKAAARLHVEAPQCLVFEDAEAGIASAKAAGMDWVRIVTDPTP